MATPTLQRPRYVYYGGRVCLWEDAVFHISHEAVLRGLNVFEGLKGYWQPDGSFGIVALRRHFDRLRRSARLMYMPFDTSFEEFAAAIDALLTVQCDRQRDAWIRATLYGEEGHWGVGSTSNLVLTAYSTAPGRPAPVRAGVSTWQRAADLALPSRIKTSSNYQVARFAKFEGRARDCDDMILLNQWGRVAEGIGACVLIVRDGRVSTPPAWEGALESITLDVVEGLCRAAGIDFARRPVERSELCIADEIGLVGTLCEVTQVVALDGREVGQGPVLGSLAESYHLAATGVEPFAGLDIARMPGLTQGGNRPAT